MPSSTALFLHALLAALPAPAPARSSEAPARNVRIDGQRFVLASTGAPIVLSGPNVVVKGPPYLPSVDSSQACNDTVNAQCRKSGTCKSCSTFSQADVDHLKSEGWNTIRLGVVWAGAQPRDEDSLDADFEHGLHALLNLTDRNGIHVVLDNHGDMVGSAGCGNGVPMWLQKKAAPDLIGKPLKTPLPFDLVKSLSMSAPGLNNVCGDNATRWAEFAGDPNYNLLNSCCQAMNSPNPPALGWTEISQKTMDYVLTEGRDDFVRFWRLIATAARQHPSAFAAELMNEPMSIHRKLMYETWKASAKAINAIIPDMSVSISDTSEGAVIAVVAEKLHIPDWLWKLISPELNDLEVEMVNWIKSSNNLFYSWHWYGEPTSIPKTIQDVQALSAQWNVPTFATEFTSCDVWKAAAAANISHTYWHYSAYCNTGPYFGSPKIPEESFGACILGWAGGNPSKCPGENTDRLAVETLLV